MLQLRIASLFFSSFNLGVKSSPPVIKAVWKPLKDGEHLADDCEEFRPLLGKLVYYTIPPASRLDRTTAIDKKLTVLMKITGFRYHDPTFDGDGQRKLLVCIDPLSTELGTGYRWVRWDTLRI